MTTSSNGAYRTLLAAGAVVVALAFVGLVWPTRYRSVTLSVSARYLAAREDRFTGRVDVLTPVGWKPLVAVADTTDPLAGYRPDWRKTPK